MSVLFLIFQSVIAAAMSDKSPWASPIGLRDEANLAKSALAEANSDHLTLYKAYLGYDVEKLFWQLKCNFKMKTHLLQFYLPISWL